MSRLIKQGIVVLYHRTCDDGFGAAWAAWRKLGDKARYLAVDYHQPLPRGLSGKDVYLVDFSYPPDLMEKLMQRAQRVVAIDHHKTGEISTRMAPEHRFALEHSGAVLAWNYFHPGEKVPRLLLHLEDYDLWRFSLRGTNEVRAVLGSHPNDFATWSHVATQLQSGTARAALVSEGTSILRYQARVVEQMVASAQLVHFCGIPTSVVNCPTLQSEIGHALAKTRHPQLPSLWRHQPLGIVWSQRGNVVGVELRSIGTLDVSELARKFGGGGHRNAAGFALPATAPLPWKPIG